MQPIFNLYNIRKEVHKGELHNDIFVARLMDLLDGTADQFFGNAQTFFDNSYVTEGLIILLNDVLDPPPDIGKSKNSVKRLETGFSDGKIHYLFALHQAEDCLPVEYAKKLIHSYIHILASVLYYYQNRASCETRS